MVKKVLVTSLIIISIFLLSFFIWHFFFSIYEVKLEVRNTTGKGNVVKTNSQMEIELIGINSFGWELPFREIRSKVEIVDGKDLIELSQFENSIIIKTLNTKGRFTIKVIPILSLNPTQFSCNIVKYN